LAAATALAIMSTSALAADATLPGSALIVPSGLAANVSLYGGWSKATSPQDASYVLDIPQLKMDLHVGTVVGNVGIQGDVWGGTSTYSSLWGDVVTSNAGAGLHINRRGPSGLIGGTVSLGVSPGGYDETFVNAAIDGRYDIGNVSLSGQAGYTTAVSRSGTATNFSLQAPDSWYGHAIARWFANDNLMLAAEGGYANFADAVSTGHVWRWGLRAEYKPAAAPFSAFAAYRGHEWTQPPSTVNVHSALVGLTFIAGDETLANRYRGAASLEDYNIFYGVNWAQ
jgi:hypothetical protein